MQVTIRLLNYKKNGERFINQITMTPLLDRNGKLLQFLGVQKDVTADRVTVVVSGEGVVRESGPAGGHANTMAASMMADSDEAFGGGRPAGGGATGARRAEDRAAAAAAAAVAAAAEQGAGAMEGPASVGGPPTAGIDLAIEESANELASMVESILFDFHERDLQFMGDTNDQFPTNINGFAGGVEASREVSLASSSLTAWCGSTQSLNVLNSTGARR